MNITVGIFSKRRGISQALADVITSPGNHCTVVESFGKLMEYMRQTRNLQVLLIDDQTFAIPKFDLNEHIRRHNRNFTIRFLSEIARIHSDAPPLPASIVQEIRSICCRDQDYQKIIHCSPIKLSAEEKDLLHRYQLRPGHASFLKYLDSHQGRLLQLDSMERYIWPESDGHTQTLYTYIHQIRKRLPELNPTMIIERLSPSTYCYHDAAVPVQKESGICS